MAEAERTRGSLVLDETRGVCGSQTPDHMGLGDHDTALGLAEASGSQQRSGQPFQGPSDNVCKHVCLSQLSRGRRGATGASGQRPAC